MDAKSIRQCINARRSVRRYADKAVTRQQIESLLAAGCMAPSGSNLQAWRFVVVDEPALLRKVRAVSPGISGWPPSLIVFCSDLALALEQGGVLARDELALMDVCLAAENVMLAATADGLATCIVKSFQASMLQRLLRLPDSIRPQLIVTLGYPAEPSGAAPPRRPLEAIVSYNGWEDVEHD